MVFTTIPYISGSTVRFDILHSTVFDLWPAIFTDMVLEYLEVSYLQIAGREVANAYHLQ